MINLKRDLKNLARTRREIFKDIEFTKGFYNNREALGKLTKTYERDFYKAMKKLNNRLKEIEDYIEAVFNEAREGGLSVEDINILILQGLSELDLEEQNI